MDHVIDAAEWELQHSTTFKRFPLVRDTPKGPVRHYQASALIPKLVMVFGFEVAGGEEKVLLLDVWIRADDESGSSEAGS